MRALCVDGSGAARLVRCSEDGCLIARATGAALHSARAEPRAKAGESKTRTIDV